MKQSTFLISRFLIEKYPEQLKNLTGIQIRELLHHLLSDKNLWKKISLLKSRKYTKQYQAVGQHLERFDFYALPEDWCLLSILSNGTGFSRCYIFIYLLEFELGENSLENDGTPAEIFKNCDPYQFFCCTGLDKLRKIYQRKLKTNPMHPEIPKYPPIHL